MSACCRVITCRVLPCQYILSIHPVNTSCQHILSTHPVNTSYPHILSYYTLSTHPNNPPYQHILPPPPVFCFSLRKRFDEIEEARERLNELRAQLEEAGMTGGGMGSTQERLLTQEGGPGRGRGRGQQGGETRGRQAGRKKMGAGGGVKKPTANGHGARASSTSARASSRDGGSRGNMRSSKGQR